MSKSPGNKDKPKKAASKTKPAGWRLSDVDVHYLVGYLHVVTRCGGAVVLGERVRDVATGTERDVDIVVSGAWGLLGVEVKDKGRALDVGIVEGICQKFADMPELTECAMVSSSDYTEPARRKAAAHGVKCLRFVRGPIPAMFQSTDLSELRAITLRHARWRRRPRVTVSTTTGDTLSGLPWSTRLIAEGAGPRSLRQMVERIPDKTTGPTGPIDCDVAINYPLTLGTPDGPRVARFRVEGVVDVTHSESPLRTTCYLADERGDALAATVLFDYGSGLVGVATTPEQRITVIPIPPEARRRRPYRQAIK